ncbi:MAG: 16S rRNA (cytosine(1402)-N(4))-methyltransferase RsmH [Bdellovibrio sp.]|nr:MAG: 16S rRNA (cytosine(1402)-N(4))-methyltransferase RsmH [Bdellovibrio sp.]
MNIGIDIKKQKELHQPVLLQEVLSYLYVKENEDSYVLDGTFGRGGHARAILEKFPQVKLVALDRDEEAVRYGKMYFQNFKDRFFMIHKKFSELSRDDLLLSPFLENSSGMDKEIYFQSILIDLGVSSPQLDQAERGFSFYQDGPLDMRMDRSEGESLDPTEVGAAKIINTWSKSGLIKLFKELGEVRRPERVVDAILNQRKTRRFSTTGQLAGLIARVQGWRQKGKHPATQFFLALRLQVNQELQEIQQGLPHLVSFLGDQGRLLVISFHSLEDRIVKYLFKEFEEKGLGKVLTKKVVKPKWEEKKKNPRARSAYLRVFERRKT